MPEVIFLLLAGVVLWEKQTRLLLFSRRWDTLDYGVLVLILSQWITAMVSGDWLTNKAIYGELYLALLYYIGRTILASYLSVDVNWINRTILCFGALLVLTVVFSWSYVMLYPAGTLEVSETKYIPNIGDVRRIEALTMSPNMLMNMLMLPLFVSIGQYLQERRWQILPIILFLSAAALATFSKSIVLAGVGVLLLCLSWFRIPPWLRTLVLMSLGLIVVLFFISSKFLLIKKDQLDRSHILAQSYATEAILYSDEERDLYKSMHFVMNKEAYDAFLTAPYFGIGPGQFVAYINQRKAAGLYPTDKISYGPHSLYLGVLAQSGLLGFSGLLFFLFTIANKWRSLWNHTTNSQRGLMLAIGVYLLIWLLDGLSMDTLHFRHFWWIAALVGAWKTGLGEERDEGVPKA